MDCHGTIVTKALFIMQRLNTRIVLLNKMSSHKYARSALILFVLAGALYNSWILGYILNPQTARNGLASDLTFSGQPYAWLFILSDVLVALSLLAVSVLVYIVAKPIVRSGTWRVAFGGVLIFGLFTAASAAVPQGCVKAPVLTLCIPYANTQIGADGIETTIACLGFLASLIAVNVLGWRQKTATVLRRLIQAVAVAWTLSAIAFLVALDTSNSMHPAQQALMIISGLGLVVIGLHVSRGMAQTKADSKKPHTTE